MFTASRSSYEVLYFCLFLAAIAVSAFLTRWIRDLSQRHGWVVGPLDDRHVHTKPIPRVGGVSIYVTVASFLLFLELVAKRISTQLSAHSAVLILVPGTFLFLVGLYDDLRGLSAKTKLAAQVIAGLILYATGFKVLGLPAALTASPYEGVISLAATIFWVLWISNAFNLIDGLDGLAGGVGLFSIITMFAVSLGSGNYEVALASIILAGTILGFLRFNFNPATIFLGDSGSLFLGFTLSALALAGQQQSKTPTLVTIAVPLVSFGLPLIETLLSVVRRFLNGSRLFDADREHIHHKLLEKGLTHRQVVVTLYAISAMCALLSLLLLYPAKVAIWVVLFILGVVLYFGIQQLRYHEFSELARVAQRTVEQKAVIVNNLAVRKLAHSLVHAKTFPQAFELLKTCFDQNEFDAFELVARQETDMGRSDIYRADQPPFTLTAEWNRPGTPLSVEDPVWALSLDLVTPAHGNVGYLKLVRRYGEGNLLIDVNLLVAELQPALSTAVARTLRSSLPQHSESFPLVERKHRAQAAGSQPLN
jgi:UDP-GlcNAc:undecaprenyl-phosphate GlcNAc-1-phosphate transferase